MQMNDVKKISLAMIFAATIGGLRLTALAVPLPPEAKDDIVKISTSDARIDIQVLDNDIATAAQTRIVYVGKPLFGVVEISTEGAKDLLIYRPTNGQLGGVDRFPYVTQDALGRITAAIVHVSFSEVGNRNSPPLVNAGKDQVIQSTVTALSGKVSDDGRIQPLQIKWEVLGASNPVRLYRPDALNPIIEFVQPGVYEFLLSAFDGEFTSSDTVTVVVHALPVNKKPIVNAGVDQTVQELSALLRGVALDDGLNDPIRIKWRVIGSSEGIAGSSEGVVGISPDNRLNAWVIFSKPGFYTFELEVFDGQYTVTDRVTIQVLEKLVRNPAAPQPSPSPTPALLTGSKTEVRLGENLIFNLSLSQAGKLDLKLFDRTGAESESFPLGNFNAGSNRVEVPSGEISKGLHRAALLLNGTVLYSFYISIL